MLKGTTYSQAYHEMFGAHSSDDEGSSESDDDDDDDGNDKSRPVDNPDVIMSIKLARTRGT